MMIKNKYHISPIDPFQFNHGRHIQSLPKMSVAFCKPDRGDIIHEMENADGWIWWWVVGAVLPNGQMGIHQSSIFCNFGFQKKWSVNARERA